MWMNIALDLLREIFNSNEYIKSLSEASSTFATLSPLIAALVAVLFTSYVIRFLALFMGRLFTMIEWTLTLLLVICIVVIAVEAIHTKDLKNDVSHDITNSTINDFISYMYNTKSSSPPPSPQDQPQPTSSGPYVLLEYYRKALHYYDTYMYKDKKKKE